MVTIWQEIEGKSERTFTADLERDREHPRMLGLEHAQHRTALYRTRKRLSEHYMRRLNRRIFEGLKPAKKLGRTPQASASPEETALGLPPTTAADADT